MPAQIASFFHAPRGGQPGLSCGGKDNHLCINIELSAERLGLAANSVPD